AARAPGGRALHGPMGDDGADRYVRAAVHDGVEPRNPLDVDQVARPQQAFLHQEEQLGAAGVRARVLAEAAQQAASLLRARRPMKRERTQHAQAPSAAAGRTISSAIIWRHSTRAATPRGRL